MTRRLTWTIGAGVATLVIAGAAVWLWQSTSVPRPAPASPAATVAPTADAQALAQQQLDEHLESCTAEEITGGAVPEGCGIRIPWGTEFAAVASVRFRIERMPVLELTDDGFIADGGVLVATVSGTGQDGAARTETYRTESWSVRGNVAADGDRVDLDVW
ncbi:hypothetical protein [Microbacterium sp. Leaf320]|uniref:hypothetical protein n=1 Tax=Microbacterium sp. Leaf320 TaxID=1736334 RepID=UPI0006F6DD2A|nr:hypothetical protein [Microbacterium sp. Leaf320]KQQ68676.1 hypothetical protein ASF63_01390 [Microbacterium sp. Leaf320]